MTPKQNIEPDDSLVTHGGEDPVMERIVLIFLIVFLIALIFVPSEWFLKLSMWWNGIN